MSDYPEHDKMMAVKDESQAIGEFLDVGLARLGLRLCESDEHDRWWPASISIEKLLADYFEIDLNVIEREKREMLAQQRRLNGHARDAREAAHG
jgi:hypothetical protein